VRANLAALFAGVIFGVGLIVSQMVRPSKVLGFLDFAGAWDPSLAFVMAGAVSIHFALGLVVRRRGRPWFAPRFELPTRRDVDRPLLAGAAIFGLGWGLAGYCPGPAIVTAATGAREAVVFALAMVVGVLIHRATTRPRSEESTTAAESCE
jgi:uncharacterized membrane protein YedE/YeeE